MTDEVKEEVPASNVPDLTSILSAFEGAPSPEQIEEWKQKHGDVFCSGFSDLELFIWRPLTRREYVDMQVQIAQSQSPVNSYEVEETVVKQCLLWGSALGYKSLNNKAGSYSTMQEQILQNSNFMNVQVASQLVFKL